IAERLDCRLPATARAQARLLQGCLELGEGCRLAGKVQSAADSYRRAQVMGARVLAARANDSTVHKQMIAAHMNCATLFAVNGKLDEALACMSQASAGLDRLPACEPMTLGPRPGLVKHLTLLA